MRGIVRADHRIQSFQHEVTLMIKPGFTQLKWALSALSATAATLFVLTLEGHR
jgi:hypothetical protein